MRIDVTGRDLTVTLSRRNLLVLLSKLDEPGSARTIYLTDEYGRNLYVTSEDDASHYADRRPGLMHPRTESRLADA